LAGAWRGDKAAASSESEAVRPSASEVLPSFEWPQSLMGKWLLVGPCSGGCVERMLTRQLPFDARQRYLKKVQWPSLTFVLVCTVELGRPLRIRSEHLVIGVQGARAVPETRFATMLYGRCED
jgi:hypothetical protein